jgi:hypothetical protein
VLAAAAVAVAAVGAGSATPASAATTAQVDITFDGYCDGLHLKYKAVNGFDYTVEGSRTGCAAGPAVGVAKPNKNGKFGITKGSTFLMLEDSSIHTVLKKDGTWVHYCDVGGGTIGVCNSGTWSLGAPAKAGGGSSSAASGAAKAPARTQATLNVAFDGYCDGMTLNKPSVGLGTGATIDGSSFGTCIATRGVIGSYSKDIGGKNAYIGYVND